MNPKPLVDTSVGKETATQTVTRVKDALKSLPEQPDNPIVSSENLNNQADIQIPDPVTGQGLDIASDMLKGTGESIVNQLQEKATQERERAEQAKNVSLADYTQALANQTGLEGFMVQEEQKRGVVELASEVARLEGDIRTEQLARSEYKTRLESKGGGLKIGADAEYQNFARDSLFRETNAVIQLGVQSGRLDAVQKTVERIAKAYYEQEQNELQARKAIYDDNKDMFTAKEQREFTIQYDQAKRELDRKERELETLQNTKIDIMTQIQAEGAPDSIVSLVAGSKTPEEVIKNAGNWIGKTDREYKRLRNAIEAQKYNDMINALNNPELIDDETREKIGKFAPTQTAISQINLASGVNELIGMIDDYGSLNPADRESANKINSLRSNLMLQIAQAYGQGAISEGDRDQYNDLLGKGWTKQTSTAGLKKTLGSLNNQIETNINLVEATYPDSVNFEPFVAHMNEMSANDYIDEFLSGDDFMTDEEAILDYMNRYYQTGPYKQNI